MKIILQNCITVITFIVLCLPPRILSYKNPQFIDGRNTIVHLFEWKWPVIADECEGFLKEKGYAGVQISPPNENLIIKNGRPWWERYQPVSYHLKTRSGDEESFKEMCRRCNNAGIRIYVDAVINHMTAADGIGTGGNLANYSAKSYPAVPYSQDDFHADCELKNFDNNNESRNCKLVGLLDLNQGREHVRLKIIEYMNHLIDLGVAGFRIDAARHMWPSDLGNIYGRLKNLNEKYFEGGSRPFIYQEVVNMDRDYLPLGALVGFKHGKSLSNVFRGNDKLKWLTNWGPAWGLIDGSQSVAFIDNHDTQRHPDETLTYKMAKRYKMAIAFMLGHPYSKTTRIMSSYAFDNFDQGPPSDKNTSAIISPAFRQDNTCTNGWICEHRWREIFNMIEFKNVVSGTLLDHWWSDGDQQISFCRGSKGFMAFSNWGDIDRELQTCLPAGIYCDVISGGPTRDRGNCTGKSVIVGSDGMGRIKLGGLEFNGVLAIHAESGIIVYK